MTRSLLHRATKHWSRVAKNTDTLESVHDRVSPSVQHTLVAVHSRIWLMFRREFDENQVGKSPGPGFMGGRYAIHHSRHVS